MSRSSAGCFSPLKAELRRPEQALGGESQGRFPGEPHPDAGVREGLDDEKGVPGAAAAEPRHGVHEVLLHLHGNPDGIEDLHRQPEIRPPWQRRRAQGRPPPRR